MSRLNWCPGVDMACLFDIETRRPVCLVCGDKRRPLIRDGVHGPIAIADRHEFPFHRMRTFNNLAALPDHLYGLVLSMMDSGPHRMLRPRRHGAEYLRRHQGPPIRF